MFFSIRNKIITFVAVPVAVICIGAMAWSLSYVRDETYTDVRRKLAEKANGFADRFDDNLANDARLATTTAAFLSSTDKLKEKELYTILEGNVLRINNVYGAAIAFEPGTYYSDDRLFAPYVYKDENGTRKLNITRDTLDWYNDEQWQWWHLAKEKSHGIWTDPYFDDGAGNILMVTYSAPFMSEGKFHGVATVDVSLPGLRNTMGDKILGNQKFDILTADGHYVFSSNTDRIMSQTFQERAIELGREDLLPLAERILVGSNGTEQISGIYGEESHLIAYATIPSTNWTLVTYTPESVAYSEFNDKIAWVISPFIITLLLILGSIILVARRLSSPVRVLQKHALGIALGAPDTSVLKINSRDEIGDLAEAFSTMQSKVADRENRLKSARESSLEELLESTPDGMIMVDTHDKIQRCNRTVKNIFGFSKGSSDLRDGKTYFMDLLANKEDEAVIEELAKWIKDPKSLKPSTALHLKGRRQNGEEFPIDAMLSPFQEPNERRIVITIRDVTEQKNAERILAQAKEEAVQASHAKSDFLASMSHELRTPLNGVLGYAQILKRGSSINSSQKKHLDAIINSGDHLLFLINDILDLAKIEAGRIEVDSGSCDLHSLVESVADISSYRATEKNLAFSIEVAPEIPRGIITDENKVRQILINLLANAIKFTAQGAVVLRVSETPKTILQFEVIDTGVGIPADELEDIFDPFKQLEAGKAAGGTGLGLAISRQLAESLGGTLSLSSQLNKGSCFQLSIPLEEADELELEKLIIEQENEQISIRVAPEQEVTILVADDRKTNRDILTNLLVDVGFKVHEADDGDVAIELIHKTHPDLVLLDIRMPRLNGIEALKQIRADSQINQTKVIAVTASVFPEFRHKALEAGFNDFLGKPFRTSELFRLLVKHLPSERIIQEEPISEETSTPTDESGSKSTEQHSKPLPLEVIEELKAAIAIRSLTAVNQLCEKLLHEPGFKATALRIKELTQKFDFASLAVLIEEFKTESTD